MYVITGATGKTGKPIAETLLQAGKEVRVIARREERLRELGDKGATILVGDLADEQFLTRAFQGATAVYAMIPPDYRAEDYRAHQLKVGAAITVALRRNRVPYVVTLSSVGAHLPEGSGIVQGLHEFEQMINKIEGINALHLRPSYFMENLYGQIAAIRQKAVMGSPVIPDLPIPLVSARDIAAVAAEQLLGLDFKGMSVRYLLGPRDVTYNEVTQVIGQAIGKADLGYVQIPYEEAIEGMAQAGFSLDTAERVVELARAFNEGDAMNAYTRDARSTTPTSIEEFARSFAVAFKKAGG